MRCGQDCLASVDVTEWLTEAEDKGWQTLSVDLSCLVEAGVDPSMVLSPFYMTTEGPLQIKLYNVRLEMDYQGQGLCP